MPYIEGRIVHDADAHTFETPGWLDPYLSAEERERLAPLLWQSPERADDVVRQRAGYDDPEYVARNEADITLRKNYAALGAFVPEERPAAIDHLGVASQLTFTTAGLRVLNGAETQPDPAVTETVVRAHNRYMADFCAVDRRLLAALYVPFCNLDLAGRMATEAIEAGAAALMVPSACPRNHSPTHIRLDTVWAQAEEAGIPIVFHVGGGTALNPMYKENGLPPVKDFHGGDDNFTSVSYMAIPDAPMQTLATMVFDGVLDRFPRLRVGVIEMGASWLPGLMRSMDSAAHAFVRNETRLQNLSLTPSEFVRRQVRVTPYPHEPAGWVIEQTGPEVCLFSSDYPHVEGGRNPLRRFETSLDEAGIDDERRDRFYRANFEDLMGSALGALV
ncbi:MAG: amidohydrolase family protein [Acidimicrobiales bacterium]